MAAILTWWFKGISDETDDRSSRCASTLIRARATHAARGALNGGRKLGVG